MQELCNTETRLKQSVVYKKACKIVQSKLCEFINTKTFGAYFSVYLSLMSS